jgi:hypothetical protein
MGPEQHHGRSGETRADLGDDHPRGLGCQQPAQARAGQPVGREHPLLELDQGVEVGLPGRSHANLHGLAGTRPHRMHKGRS